MKNEKEKNVQKENAIIKFESNENLWHGIFHFSEVENEKR